MLAKESIEARRSFLPPPPSAAASRKGAAFRAAAPWAPSLRQFLLPKNLATVKLTNSWLQDLIRVHGETSPAQYLGRLVSDKNVPNVLLYLPVQHMCLCAHF